MEKKYAIKMISGSCGILPHTLRVWEKRYNVFNPERSEGGQRLYSEEDLKKAKLLAKLIEVGHSISNIASYSVPELEEMISSYQEDMTPESRQGQSVNIARLLRYLSSYDIEKVTHELQHLRISTGVKSFIFHIVLPTMREIGTLVAKGKYSVTQEHIISSIIRDQLGQVNLPNLGQRKSSITIATPEGNIHELSILIADLLAKTNRVSTHYLGAAHPAECLAEAMNALKSSVLVLGVVSSDQWDYQKSIVKYLEKIDRHLKEDIQVYLGGGYELDFPSFKNISRVEIMKTFEDFDKYLEELSS